MPWVLLAASVVVWLLAPVAGMLAAASDFWSHFFPGAASYPVIGLGLVVSLLFAVQFRGSHPLLVKAMVGATTAIAATSILLRIVEVVTTDAALTGTAAGLLPALSALLLAVLATVLESESEFADQLALSLCSTVFCFSIATALIALATHSGGAHMPLSVPLPAGLGLALLAAAAFTWRRRAFPAGMFSSDTPAWRAVRVGIPLAILVPIDRFVLIANREAVSEALFVELDLIITILNVLIIALLFSWTIWKLAHEYHDVRRKEERLALAVEAPGVGMFDWNVKTGEVMWTPDTERRVGLAPGSIRHIDDLLCRIRPEDWAAVEATRIAVEVEGGDHYTFRYHIHTADGGLRTFEGSARCFYGDKDRASMTRVIGLNLDITEREQHEVALADSETQLRSIIENVPDAMVVADEDGRILGWSHAAERMFGYGEAQVRDADLAMLLPPELAGLRAYYAARRQQTGESQLLGRAVTLKAMRADGEIFPIELTVGEARARGARIFICFVRDITERVEAQQHLDSLRDEFAHSARLDAMGEMAAGLAHELNQPLAAGANYLGAAEMIAEDEARDDELAELLGSARGQLMRAGEIIRRLRDFLAKGRADMRVEQVGETVREAIELGLFGNQQHHIAVSCEVAPGAEAMLADRVQVQQVLVNLLRNAAEAVRDLPRPRRSIRIDAAPRDAETLEIRVTDQGPGLSDQVLAQLYTPFVSTKGPGGLGVGLSICRRIVEAHGGEFVAGNHPGGGASIAFTLPRPRAGQENQENKGRP